MDWFERLTGFRESGYAETQARLEAADGRLRSLVNGASYGIGTLELVALHDLRARAKAAGGPAGRLRMQVIEGDVRQLHRAAENAGALFQVASQFNLLEMDSDSITPEQGVTRYQHDGTQGPACAIAAGAATIYRNYLVPIGNAHGQTATRQLDGLADLGAALSSALNRPVGDLWTMRNGYALATRAGLDAITKYLGTITPDAIDDLRGKLRIGLQTDVEVTDRKGPDRHHVSQAFCSALPLGYSDVAKRHWAAFAALVLEAAYEATLWAAVLNAQSGRSNVLFLTLLGGGVFRNDRQWILAAIRRALALVANLDLDVRLVSHGPPSADLLALAASFP
jgi:hypothetical protein